MKQSIPKKSRVWWLLLVAFVVTRVIFYVFKKYPDLYNNLYYLGLFRDIRSVSDWLFTNWIPVPLIYFVLLLALSYLIMSKGILVFLKRLVILILINIVLFYWCWGFNYAQPSLRQTLDLKGIQVDSSRLVEEMDWCIKRINTIRPTLGDLSSMRFREDTLNHAIRATLKNTFNLLNLETAGKPVVKILRPKGLLMHFSTAGIYIPQAFQGHIDAGLLPIEYPFTMAHEMSHAYGITDEAACNFTGFLACINSDNLFFQYSALLDYSLYLRSDLYKLDKNLYTEKLGAFHAYYHHDIQRMRENNKKYPDLMPKVRDFLYDQFLKQNGIQAGLKSYSQMVSMVIQYRDQYDDLNG